MLQQTSSEVTVNYKAWTLIYNRSIECLSPPCGFCSLYKLRWPERKNFSCLIKSFWRQRHVIYTFYLHFITYPNAFLLDVNMDFIWVAGRSTPALRLPQSDLPYQKVCVCMYVCMYVCMGDVANLNMLGTALCRGNVNMKDSFTSSTQLF